MPSAALHRKAQWRLDFVAAENSMGFHAPQEMARILGEAIDFARQGQLGDVGSLGDSFMSRERVANGPRRISMIRRRGSPVSMRREVVGIGHTCVSLFSCRWECRYGETK